MYNLRVNDLTTDAGFLAAWAEAATTSAGFFWMAFWAFGLGYLMSSAIQVFVTQARMQRAMGRTGTRSVALGTLFGFVSSSCSFAALSTSRTLFAKGAGAVPSLAFLLASTNLVVELGIVIAAFLSWQFVVGEYVGGLLLILLTWGLVRFTASSERIEEARRRARRSAGLEDEEEEQDLPGIRERLAQPDAWRQVARRYRMEWDMVYEDVLIGFSVAGIIAAFVPDAFFETLFVGSGSLEPTFGQVVAQAVIGPVAAFFTFIGSMGNIPLAAVLYSGGVSFAGVMAFVFSDLVVFPVLRIQAEYYGWRVALYVASVFFVALVTTSVALHHGFALLGMLPDPSQVPDVTDRTFFAVDHTLVLNIVFGVVTVAALVVDRFGAAPDDHGHDHGSGTTIGTWVLHGFALLSLAWLVGGLVVAALQ